MFFPEMKAACLIFTLTFSILVHSRTEAQNQTDAFLDNLAEEVIRLAKPEAGIGKEGQELSESAQKLNKREVIAILLPLLEHEKKGVPYLASYIILDCSTGLQAEDLDRLKKGWRNGGGWLPGAIASLETEEAAEFLAKEFRANPQTQAQIDWALASMGKQAVPYILKEFDDADPKREKDFFDGIRHVFKEMRFGAETALPNLIATAESKEVDRAKRIQAALTIGYIGIEAEPYFPRLRKLADDDPGAFADAVAQSIIASGSKAAAEILADRVDSGGEWYTVREIALMGANARDIGPRVMKWLDSDNWEIRVMAARTLGAIGYKDAIKTLEDLLDAKMDWRMALVAAESLAELHSKESIPALKRAAENHWFPIVRNTSLKAIADINAAAKPKEEDFGRIGELIHHIDVIRENIVVDEKSREELKINNPKEAETGKRISFSAFESREPELALKFLKARDTNGEEMLKEYGQIVTFPITGGLLLGAQAGEWTGGLHFAPKQGAYRKLAGGNFTGIVRWKDRILVSCGTYHMGMNEGMIQEVVIKEGQVTLKPWFALPGMPDIMEVSEDGRLVAICVGGAVAFSEPEKFQYYGTVQKIEAPGEDDDLNPFDPKQ